MDLVRVRIPYQFIRDRVPLGWREIQFGLQNGFLEPSAAIDAAVQQLLESKEPAKEALDLAGRGRSEPVSDLVELLAHSEPARTEELIRRKWLYLVLSWLYQHRDQDADPLQRVEEVYADFGYPEELGAFVRYMPMVGPDLGSREANEQRLMERWKEYLDGAASEYYRGRR